MKQTKEGKKMKKKAILILGIGCLVGLTMTGCIERAEDTPEYKAFIEKYGNSKRFFCDESTGFLMQEFFWSSQLKRPSLDIVENDIKQPVRCGKADILSLETSAGTTRIVED